MKALRCLAALVALLLAVRVGAAPANVSPAELLTNALDTIYGLVEPAQGVPARALTADLTISKAKGVPSQFQDAVLKVALAAPDRIKLTATVGAETYTLCRNGQQVWVHVPGKKFAVVGEPETPRFSADPSSIDKTLLAPLKLPITRQQMTLYTLLVELAGGGAQAVGNEPCNLLTIRPSRHLADLMKLPPATLTMALRDIDSLPQRIQLSAGDIEIEVDVTSAVMRDSLPADTFTFKANKGDNVEKTAVSHLSRFFDVALSGFSAKVPTLGPVMGERKLLAKSGAGRLELHDGTKVLLLQGTPEEMGKQHGELLKNEVRDVTNRILYGVGVGSSFAKGSWFFGEIERAHARLAPYISERTYRELDALAAASGMDRNEVRLSNFFPELFHCSGFALAGEATVDGKMYHGRILDYMRGVGLEQNAVVMVLRPEKGNAWVNIGYAGFIGSVTAMNEKHISLGEMGGRGEGNWDGKPMAQLVREVMENAGTLEEAVEIFKKGPRTCEYYYVIADGKSKRSVAIKATPAHFEVVNPGEAHPQLQRPVKDTVLLSAGDRYEKLVDRVQAGYGKFDAESARALMDPPVCMGSNIQSVLFAPETLDFWVANADSKNVASKTRYTKYNLGELLKTLAP